MLVLWKGAAGAGHSPPACLSVREGAAGLGRKAGPVSVAACMDIGSCGTLCIQPGEWTSSQRICDDVLGADRIAVSKHLRHGVRRRSLGYSLRTSTPAQHRVGCETELWPAVQRISGVSHVTASLCRLAPGRRNACTMPCIRRKNLATSNANPSLSPSCASPLQSLRIGRGEKKPGPSRFRIGAVYRNLML